ncbi:hypothetical protein [Polynucleobacter sinensis]|uniref:hypothetical protein n=1 Tax=Polynucleobacter sinensis TaxID=1743157 RepID=UPI0012E80553|nr:hypothetical protein [Polynucleobacter sinensis]
MREIRETMYGLYRCGALATKDLEEFIKQTGGKTKKSKLRDPDLKTPTSTL